MKGSVADLPAVLGNAFDVRAVGEFEPDQMAQQMGVRLCHLLAVLRREQRYQTLLEFLSCQLYAVAVGNLQAPGQDVAQQPIRLALRERVGAPLEEVEVLRLRFGPVVKFIEQPALANTGLTQHRHN